MSYPKCVMPRYELMHFHVSCIVETPDPFVILRVRTSPNSRQQTNTLSDTYNPVWNESFTFYLNHDKKNTLGMLSTILELNCLPQYSCLHSTAPEK